MPDKWVPFIRINYAYPEGMESVNGLVQEQIAQSPPPPIAGQRG